MALPVILAKIGMPRAGSENEIVVGDFAIGELHTFAISIDPNYLAENNFGVRLFAQNGAHRCRDLRRRQRRRRDLIK